MASIYARAGAVICWLGPASADSALALDALQDLGTKIKRANWKLDASKGIDSISPSLNNAALELSQDANRWIAITSFTERPYWSRRWIFQEMVSARRLLVLCGNILARSVKLPLAFLIWWQRMTPRSLRRVLGAECASMIHVVHLYEHTLLGEAFGRCYPPTLFVLLEGLRRLNASDPRDVIFALITLAADKLHLRLEPDYSKDYATVLKEAACSLLRGNHIQVIAYAITVNKG